MNLAFWGREHESGTTANMIAIQGMLRAICGEKSVITGRFLRENAAAFALCDCQTGLTKRRRHFLWHADLAVINLKQKKDCVERFFDEDIHIAKHMIFLLGGYECEEELDAEYLGHIYRIEPEQVVVIPYNNAFYQALERGESDAFIKKELCAPTNFANQQFISSVWKAAVCIMKELGYELTESKLDRRMNLWNRL